MNQDLLPILSSIHPFARTGLPIHRTVKSEFDSDLYVPRCFTIVLR
ncbi:MAG: hypothetical protein JW776_10090 [Candidatus Lokiarchaeota archaeon]|nr:hypothetical protein [Candidatus Lokiarchaeota archaeon]